MKHLTILNPTAGSYSAREHDSISQALAGLEGKVLATSNLSELEDELQKYDGYSPDILGIGGGDGTVSRTLTKVKEKWPILPRYVAIYALGTMNNVAMPVGVSAGLIDRIKRFARIGNTKPVQLAQYLQKAMKRGEVKTQELTPLNINEKWGFNAGFGLTTKLVWMYYGRTAEQYTHITQRLQLGYQGEYDAALDRLAPPLHKKSGMIQSAKTALESINAMHTPSSPIYRFFNQPLDAQLYVDGRKIEYPLPITGIYIASYEQQNVGIFRGTILPNARAVPGTMEVLISSASVKDVIMSLPAMMRGRPMRKTHYAQAHELRLESGRGVMGQVDGELTFGKEFVIRPDKPLKFISLK